MSEWTVLLEELWSQRIGKKKTCTALWNICRKMNNSRERNTSIDVTEHTNVITQITIFDCTFVIFSWASQTEVMEQGCREKLPSSVQIVSPPANNLFFRLLQLEKKWQEICVSTFKIQACSKCMGTKGHECWLNYRSAVSLLALESTFLEIIGERCWRTVAHINIPSSFSRFGKGSQLFGVSDVPIFKKREKRSEGDLYIVKIIKDRIKANIE